MSLLVFQETDSSDFASFPIGSPSNKNKHFTLHSFIHSLTYACMHVSTTLHCLSVMLEFFLLEAASEERLECQ